jgi:hypothetical protein
VQTADGELLIEVAGPSSADQLIINGVATMGGTLTVSTIKGCEPVPGQSFTILAAAAVKGTFDQVNVPANLEVTYTPASVVLEVIDAACPADLFPFPSGDGIVGPGDLAVLLASWGPCIAPCNADLAPADCVGDDVVGPADLAQLLANWGSCP